MEKTGWFLISVILLGGFFGLIFFSQDNENNQAFPMLEESKEKSIRQPAVAGQFYPTGKEELAQMVSRFLKEAELPQPFDSSQSGKINGLILPHAGYVFSGSVAAYGFKAIQGQEIRKVILIGPSHHQSLAEAVIDNNDSWQTSLGRVNLDTRLRDALVKESSLFKIDSSPHQPEHCLEVMLPFLQMTLKDFQILPILVNQLTNDNLVEISQSLGKYLDGQTLVIASSDMSHYPAYGQANYADKKVIEAILTGQVSELRGTINQLGKENIPNLDTCLCGQGAVEVLMTIAQEKKAEEIKLFKYANSGDAAVGDKSQAVGYSAISFSWPEESKQSPETSFNQEQKDKLLEIARTSVENYILKNKMPEFVVRDPLLNEPLGAFVTLRKDGQLRGCLGRFEPDIPLYRVVSQVALAAATQDARFRPIQVSELNDLEYEISVLSPLEKIDDWRQIELGKHGVQIRRGSISGVFLPQVAAENNWDLDKFMGELCFQKAGLSWDCWKKDDVDIYIFTAQVFGEK